MAMTRNLQPVSGRSFVFVCLKSERAFYCGDCLQTETEQS
jgi:hypothetical protein